MSTATLDTTAVRRWKRYPEYRASGTQWLAELPASWESKRLKYLAIPSRQRLFEKPPDATYIGLEQIESKTGKLFLDNSVETVESNVGVFSAGDVLFGKLRPYLAKVAVPKFAGVCTTEVSVYRPCSVIHSDYLKYQFLTREYIDFVNTMAYGTKMPRVSEEQMSELRLALPPLPEQRVIAAFLDRETSRIDALIERKERLIALLEEKRQAVISHAVTRGLDPSAPLKDSGIPYWGTIPAHWQMTKLRHLVPNHRQIMYGIVLPGPHVDDGIPIVKGGNCEPGRLQLDLLSRTSREIEAGYERSRLREGDIVYAIRGSIGAAEIVPAELNGGNLTQDAARIAPKPNVHVRWLLYTVRSAPFFAKLDAGSLGATIRGINIRDLKRADIPCPEPSEQAKIAAFLDRETQRFDSLLRTVTDGIARLQEYRTALISAAVSGQIDVRGEVSL